MSLIPEILAGLFIGSEATAAVVNDSPQALRPPGALDEHDFISKCIKCGRCIESCPYKSLVAQSGLIGSGIGAPLLDMRTQACRLCADFPCISSCPTGALQPVESRRDVRIGIAVINRELCIAVRGLRCEVCYRTCPFIDEAISIDYSMRDNDEIHAIFEPIIDPDKCVGCGLCVERCVVGDPVPAIEIVRDKDEALARIKEEQDKTVSNAWHAD